MKIVKRTLGDAVNKTPQSRTQKLGSWRQMSDIELIPPNAKEFNVYGNAATVAAAKHWALYGRYMLVQGVESCAHGLLGLRYCPAHCSRIPDFDHANVWASVAYEAPEAFVLMAPYLKKPSDDLRSYADHHGLRIDQHAIDGWYGNGSIPIRLTFKEKLNALGPLEEMLLVLNCVAPTRWPDEDPPDYAKEEVNEAEEVQTS